jgi:tRNA(adenine34) deaminase
MLRRRFRTLFLTISGRKEITQHHSSGGPGGGSSGGAEDENFLRLAVEEARRGAAAGEVPVGAVLVRAGEVIARAHNAPVSADDPTAHAEILALREGAKALGNYRLEGCTLYSTLEPCVMCAGALVHARVARLVYGARDIRFGGVRSKFRIADSDLLNHRIEVVEGVLAVECLELLREFFERRR